MIKLKNIKEMLFCIINCTFELLKIKIQWATIVFFCWIKNVVAGNWKYKIVGVLIRRHELCKSIKRLYIINISLKRTSVVVVVDVLVVLSAGSSCTSWDTSQTCISQQASLGSWTLIHLSDSVMGLHLQTI